LDTSGTDAPHRTGSGPGLGQVFLGTSGLPPVDARADHVLSMYRLTDPGLSDLALEPLLDALLDRTRKILDVDTVAVLLIDEDERELVARAAKGLEEEVKRGVRIPIGGGFAGRIAAERTPIFIADVEHADIMNPILRETGVRSLLGVPLIVEGRTVGVLHVGTLSPRRFTNEDATLLQLAAVQVAPAIDRARLFEALDREHRSAVALQRSLLPEGLPDVAGIDVAARYLPASDEVGGDWYDVIELPRGLVGFAIGDVAGHGVRAAALMGQLRTGLRAYALDGHGPGETLRRLDRLLQTIRGHGMATAAYGVIAPETGAVRLANAGHPPPVRISASGEARLMDTTTAPPLGTLPYPSYREVETSLEPGETILMYTDGLVERRGEALTVGLESLRQAASGVTGASALCERVVETLAPSLVVADDVAVVALRSEVVEASIRLRLPADPDVLAHVRQGLRRWLRAHGADSDDIAAITLACGEACANAIEHAYTPSQATFEIEAEYESGTVTLAVRDHGRWRRPRGVHRGRGLMMMEATVDELDVRATANGTEVLMRRRIGS
jgi:anti-sigma regulatory factor (Ser/Thr protein kinase)/putative methionine-R-sulfoxide reductase with GAF domain